MSFDRAEIAETRTRLSPYVRRTPVISWDTPSVSQLLGGDSELLLKLELFQVTGSFKSRAALANALSLSRSELAAGLTAVSAGNHAIAVAYAAWALGTTAKVVMIQTANPYRVESCRRYGAEIVMAVDGPAAFAQVERIRQEEGRSFIHPFDGRLTALGSATLGAELEEQIPELDAVVVAIGGGGLAGGVARAIKLLSPGCLVFGVEPDGADNMRRSLAAGAPRGAPSIRTIADSLAPPHSAQYSFELCRDHLDDLVLVGDDQIRDAMALLLTEAKLAVEPAGAAATAAACGPLLEVLRGKRTAIIVCGANIDAASFSRILGQRYSAAQAR
jgi:threonine dehydratase